MARKYAIEKSVRDLKPFARNPRKISDDQKRLLEKGLDKYGDLGGVVFNIRNNELVGGNQRSKTFLPDDRVQYTERLETPDEQGTVAHGYIIHNGKKYSYREVDWSNEDHLAASLIANKAGGDWDWTSVERIMNDLNEMPTDFDLELTGFTEAEIMPMLLSKDGEAAGDANSEWVDMPEFDQQNKQSFRHIVVHFNSPEAAEEFFKLIGQNDTGKTKSVWFPPIERRDTESKRYE